MADEILAWWNLTSKSASCDSKSEIWTINHFPMSSSRSDKGETRAQPNLYFSSLIFFFCFRALNNIDPLIFLCFELSIESHTEPCDWINAETAKIKIYFQPWYFFRVVDCATISPTSMPLSSCISLCILCEKELTVETRLFSSSLCRSRRPYDCCRDENFIRVRVHVKCS